MKTVGVKKKKTYGVNIHVIVRDSREELSDARTHVK